MGHPRELEGRVRRIKAPGPEMSHRWAESGPSVLSLFVPLPHWCPDLAGPQVWSESVTPR